MKKFMKLTVLSMGIFAANVSSAATETESVESIRGIVWQLNGHSSSSADERDVVALQACRVAIEAKINTANTVLSSFGGGVTYSDLVLDANYDNWSETKGSFWGSGRKHKAGGLADCSYFQIVSMP